MLKNEFPGLRDIVLNGEVINGRTKRRADGLFSEYDLKDANWGDTVVVVTNKASHEFVKDGHKHEAASRGWTIGGKAVEVTLFDQQGFRTSSIVLQEGNEVMVRYPDEDLPDRNKLKSLGVVVAIAYHPQEMMPVGGSAGSSIYEQT